MQALTITIGVDARRYWGVSILIVVDAALLSTSDIKESLFTWYATKIKTLLNL